MPFWEWSNFSYFSISDVHLESSGSGSGSVGRETKSSLSVESGSSRGGCGNVTWTPPAGSAEGSTPTWTEGTPSFTESSSSGDVGKFRNLMQFLRWKIYLKPTTV